ncbi:DUF6600 domain-containing protein [Caldimonas sp. KR1-144]|uniref:DUF6600 domain-containing protein n=1 Tax=Caldimonas sp. KR1-144 TaxID=3400911 RepID=UPI003C03B5DB
MNRARAPLPARWITLFGLPLLAAALALAAPRARADDDDPRRDPPARVGALTAVQGDVQLAAEPGAAWERAQLNWPVTTGTTLFVPPGGRSELRIGSSAVRLDGNSQVEFSQLDDHGVTLEVIQGTVRARVRTLPTGDLFALSSDGVRAQALQPGDYRASYDPDRRSYTVGVISGRLRVVTPTNSVDVGPGQEVTTEREGAALSLAPLSLRSDFDAWADARDRQQDRYAAAGVVSPEMTGVDTLGDHGRWATDSVYGSVWYPAAVPVGWAPYRYGRWVWIAPWGWTWVDDAPWGYAPFHYGRWALIGGRWGWCPGGYVARPVWAPALVGFVGGRSGNVSWGVSIGSAAPVGWFPLAPQEVYRPPYRHTPRYVQQINIINQTTVIVNQDRDRRAYRHDGDGDRRGNYRYAQRPEALTVVSEDRFRSSRPIGGERLRVDERQAAQLQPVAATLPVLGGGAGAVRPALPAQARDDRGSTSRPVATLPTPIRLPQRDIQRDIRRDNQREPDVSPRPGRGTPSALPWTADPAAPARPVSPAPVMRERDQDRDGDGNGFGRPSRNPSAPAVRPTPVLPPPAATPLPTQRDSEPARPSGRGGRPPEQDRDNLPDERAARGRAPAWMASPVAPPREDDNVAPVQRVPQVRQPHETRQPQPAYQAPAPMPQPQAQGHRSQAPQQPGQPRVWDGQQVQRVPAAPPQRQELPAARGGGREGNGRDGAPAGRGGRDDR